MPEADKNKNTEKKVTKPISKVVSEKKDDAIKPIEKKNSSAQKKSTIDSTKKASLKVASPTKELKPKAKSVNQKHQKGTISPALLNNPATFSKAAFEEQVQIAIRESIERQKEIQRVYDPKITDKMKSIIANYTEHPELLDNIESNTDVNFVEKLNIDSVDFVEIIVDAEESFGIKMEDEEIKALRSFDDLYDLIEVKIAEKNNPIKK